MKEERSAGPRGLSRREFLRLGWGHGLARGFEAVENKLGQRPTPVKTWVWVDTREALESKPIGTVQRVNGAFIVRLPEGIIALSSQCPNDGTHVQWRPNEPSEDSMASKGRFYCPRDASVFDRRGGLVFGPAPHGLDEAPLQTGEDGSLRVAVPQKNRPRGESKPQP